VYEEKLEKMEEEKTDEMEVATQENQKRKEEEKSTGRNIIVSFIKGCGP